MISSEFIERKASIISGCDVEEIFRFNNFPIHTFENGELEFDPCCDMIFDIGLEDGFVQLRRIVPPHILYHDTHMNAIGKVWEGMRNEVAHLIKESQMQTILELGGSTGLLNKTFNEIGGQAMWTIIEPQPSPVDGCNATYIKGFFPDDLNTDKKYDLIVHTHMLEHTEDLNVFFENVTKFIKKNGQMIFAVPDMDYLYNSLQISVMHYEHTFYLSEEYIDYLLKKYGFDLIQKKHYGNGHSVIYSVSFLGIEEKISLSEKLYKRNIDLLQNWYKKYSLLVKVWNEKIDKEKVPVYLFGAHLSSQLLFAFGLNQKRIEGLLDNDSYKVGKRVSGTKLMVSHPNILSGTGRAIVIVPETPYSMEIKNGIKNINQEVEFW